jgi:hypothetical protein
MGSIFLKLLVQYLESHPEQIAKLIEQGVEALIHAITKHNDAQKA